MYQTLSLVLRPMLSSAHVKEMSLGRTNSCIIPNSHSAVKTGNPYLHGTQGLGVPLDKDLPALCTFKAREAGINRRVGEFSEQKEHV